MEKAIYCLKIFIFRKQFLVDNKVEESKYRDVCIFIIRVYVRAWFCAPYAALAPKQDLEFIKSLYNYRSIDQNISERTVKIFSNHMWYLTPELVALSFFDHNLSYEEKIEMCKALELDCSTFVHEKKILVNDKNVNKIVQASLSDFVCKDTLQFFKRYNITPSFLTKDP